MSIGKCAGRRDRTVVSTSATWRTASIRYLHGGLAVSHLMCRPLKHRRFLVVIACQHFVPTFQRYKASGLPGVGIGSLGQFFVMRNMCLQLYLGPLSPRTALQLTTGKGRLFLRLPRLESNQHSSGNSAMSYQLNDRGIKRTRRELNPLLHLDRVLC